MRITLLAAILSLTLGAAAQTPDYSRDRLRQIFSATAGETPRRDTDFRFTPTGVEFRGTGMRWALNLPFSAPLAGSMRRASGFEPVDPFALTGTELAWTPRNAPIARPVDGELLRIERNERARFSVVVKRGQ